MSDQPDPELSDARDERLAALLAVEPLDDVTRRRLVRGALDRPVPRTSRLAAAVSIAAAVVLGGVIGVVLVHGNNDVATTTAQGAPSAAGKSEALEGAPRAADSVVAVAPLGDLGDVTAPADLQAAVATGFARFANPSEQREVTGYQCGSTAPDELGLATITGLGFGTSRGSPVTVFVGDALDGRSIAVVVRQDDCAVLTTVALPPA